MYAIERNINGAFIIREPRSKWVNGQAVVEWPCEIRRAVARSSRPSIEKMVFTNKNEAETALRNFKQGRNYDH